MKSADKNTKTNFKPKHKQKRPPFRSNGKRRPFIRKSRPARRPSNLDRFKIFARTRSILRRLQKPSKKLRGNYFARRTLHHTGSAGRASLRRVATLIRAQRPTVCRVPSSVVGGRYTPGQKYRLKTAFYFTDALMRFKLVRHPLKDLRRVNARFHAATRHSFTRRRRLFYTRAAAARRQLRLSRFNIRRAFKRRRRVHLPRRQFKARQRSKKFAKIIRARASSRNTTTLRRRSPSNLSQFRRARKRAAVQRGLTRARSLFARRGAVTRRRLRRWWSKSRLIRIRRRSRRQLAGLFGKIR